MAGDVQRMVRNAKIRIAAISHRRYKRRNWLALPSFLGGILGYFPAPFGAHACCPRLPAHAPQRHSGGVFAVLGDNVVEFAGRDLADHDGALVHVGGALFAFRASWHPDSLMLSGKLREPEWRIMGFLRNFETWLATIVILLVIFTIINPTRWLFVSGDETQNTIRLIALLLVVVAITQLITRGLWWLFGRKPPRSN